MSIFRKTLSCAVLAALGTCALAGCGRQDTSNEAATSASPEASAAITETVNESTAASEQTPAPDAPGTQSTQPAELPGSPSISIMIPSVPCVTTGILTVSASPCIRRNTAAIVPVETKNS